MNKFIITLIAASVSLTAFADPSTNGIVSPKKPAWESSVALGATLTSGNSDLMLVTTKIQTQCKYPNDEFAFSADAAYGKSSGVENNESLHGVGQYNRFFTERWFGFVRLDTLHDGIADLDYRITLSPGIGCYLLKETNTTLAVEFGPGLISERKGGVSDYYATVRLAERFERTFDNKSRIWQSIEIIPQVEAFKNYIVNAEVGVEAPISKQLSLRATLQDNYINQPADGRKQNDAKLIAGIVYRF